ncbi:DUF523 domain-containing protein [Cohnella xylanilytica]|uniref:DUF523 domain-containing protein n=1 Tax=Cohnella xylanilytica TaxID=557555 RepID=A0A841U0W0_9BACL|nr:DUF523 domain-containing protein [Cohnella xylanilytica]MBB6693062.1 DUF523 domain-containing protein [Cohnella xylanilytica]
MILVSSCLAGLQVRYNGTGCLDERIRSLIAENRAETVCPELLGGFATPREPAEIVGGDGDDVLDGRAKVVERSGRDVTAQYVEGAFRTLDMARERGATVVVLKEFSPSCGSSLIYDGEFAARKKEGVGVTTALLRRHGIRVVSEDNLAEALEGVSTESSGS